MYSRVLCRNVYIQKEENMKYTKAVVIETPLAGSTEEETSRNIEYGRACLRDCLERGEAPFASHLLYALPGVLDDTIPKERNMGMEAGFFIGSLMGITVVYTDYGISDGMQEGIKRAEKAGRYIEYRKLYR